MEIKDKLNFEEMPPEELKSILADLPLADILEEWDSS